MEKNDLVTKMEERCLAITRPNFSRMFGRGIPFQGVLPIEMVNSEFLWKNILFVKRNFLESLDEFVSLYKHFATYVIIVDSKKRTMFTYSRETGEERLLDMHSAGIGGHVNHNDYISNKIEIDQLVTTDRFEKLCLKATEREMREEGVSFVHINPAEPSLFSIEILGLVNYDGDNVGRDHCGFVTMIDLHKNNISVTFDPYKEIGMTDHHGFINVHQYLEGDYEDRELETWTECLLPAIVNYFDITDGTIIVDDSNESDNK